MRSVILVAIALLSLSLAGCVSGGDAVSPNESSAAPSFAPSEPAPEPETTDDTGALRVLTLDDEGSPISAVQILLRDVDKTQFTDTRGLATFNGLEPGEYTVLASKPGFRAAQEGGVLVTIQPSQLSETTMILAAVAVVSAATSYYEVLPLQGFYSCGIYAPGIDLDDCGEGVTISGTTYLRDPNHDVIQPWQLDNEHVTGFLVEMDWQAWNSVAPMELRFLIFGYLDCPDDATYGIGCVYRESMGGAGGSGDLSRYFHEGSQQNITGYFDDNWVWPHPMNVKAFNTPYRPVAGNNLVGASVVYQQPYDVIISTFYGVQKPTDFTGWPAE